MIVSAQEATRTRLCAAERCEQDAETNSRLCWRCAKKDSVRLHVPPDVDTSPTLRCTTCSQFKTDESFSRHHNADTGRRGRHAECKQCCNDRRRLARALLTAEQRKASRRAKQVASNRQRRIEQRELLQALREERA